MSFLNRRYTIIVACTANVTRSAYLHGYMEQYLKEHYPHVRKRIKIESAGIAPQRGSAANPVVEYVARQYGFSLHGHRSEFFTKKKVERANVVLVMEQWQKNELCKRFPKAAGKVFRMTEYLWNGEPEEIRDIPDPTGRNTVDFEDFIEVAHAEVERIFRELGHREVI